jgi:hypothetical protein
MTDLVRRLLTLAWWQARWRDVAALAALASFFVAFFPHALFGGKYLLAGDPLFYSYPMHVMAWRMLRQGILPLWSPYTLSGYPLLSMTQLGLGYPLTWGHLFLPGHMAEQVYVLAPFLLVPVFTYLYVRELGRSPLAALLAGLSFGYGGMMASPLGNSGMMTNAVAWLPLFLLAIERARTRRFVPALLLATGAYAMSVLNGFGQGFVYVGLVAVAYAVCVVLTTQRPHSTTTQTLRARLANVQQWRPLLVACGAGLLAAGVAAFQILETARVVRRSVRRTLSYELFTQGSFAPADLWRSFTTPLFYVVDMDAYAPPLAGALALIAVYAHARRQTARDPRVCFWCAVAVWACVLMMGASTPFYRLVYHVPIVNLFRVPSRHAFEWTFAVSILAAYGWDVTAAWLRKRRAAHTTTRTRAVALALLALGTVVGVLWWLKVAKLPYAGTGAGPAPATIYLLWKAAFVLLTLAALWRASLVVQPRWRYGLLLASVSVLCYVEPSAIIARWWGGGGFHASRFSAVSDATRYLRQFSPTENRIYTRVDLMSEQYGAPPRFDGANLSAVWGLHNVAGYEPLMLDRYSRALGGAWVDSVHTLGDGRPDQSLLTEQSHVLDLLNTTYLVSYANLATTLGSQPAPTSAASTEPVGELPPQTTKTLSAAPTEAAALLLITSLSNSTFEPDGQAVARLRISTTTGQVIERELQAGRDTAEWAHERADVRAVVRHRLAPVYDTTQVGAEKGYTAYRYKVLVPLAGIARVTRVEIANISQAARLAVYGAALIAAHDGRSIPLAVSDTGAWQPVYAQRDTLILRNTRACPRVWLVAEAEAVDEGEALRMIRGESTRAFDPRRTALLEVYPNELPPLPGGAVAPESTARIISYEPHRLLIETSAPTATLLMMSEIFYPGWEATIDGQPAYINVADFMLRGVVLTAGQHRVELRYTAPGARFGALISALTLCLLAGLAYYARRTAQL